MKTQTSYPRIESVAALSDKRLRVRFRNGVIKVYDCTPLLAEEPFRPLTDDALFRSVQADPHGYGVAWGDKIDLAEAELWLHGEAIDEDASIDC